MIIDGGIGGRGLVLRHRLFRQRDYGKVLRVWILGGVIDGMLFPLTSTYMYPDVK